MNDLECLSILELMDIATGDAPEDSREHATHCPRCSILLDRLREVDQPELSSAEVAVTSRPQLQRPARVGSGQVWTVARPDSGFFELVVIVGRVPQQQDQLVAAPLTSDIRTSSSPASNLLSSSSSGPCDHSMSSGSTP